MGVRLHFWFLSTLTVENAPQTPGTNKERTRFTPKRLQTLGASGVEWSRIPPHRRQSWVQFSTALASMLGVARTCLVELPQQFFRRVEGSRPLLLLHMVPSGLTTAVSSLMWLFHN
eukprot:748539-Amphidinium_carterae.1